MSVRAIARRLVGVWLMADGIWTGLWFAGLAESMGGRDAVSVTAMVARFVVAALSVAGGWLMSQRRPAGVPLGTAALLLIAMFSVIDAGARVLPTNLDPSFRWPAAWLQVTAATAAILLLRSEAREKM
jgi:hypothetical protein